MTLAHAEAEKNIKNAVANRLPYGLKEIKEKMENCICSKCKNLKSSINSEGQAGEYDCEFGFPSDKCDECDDSSCNETCINFVSDEEEDEVITVKCSKCGKELQKACKDEGSNEDENVLCIECYLGDSNLQQG
jgi:hypothetical protein